MGGFGVIQVLSGATLLSELGIDISKNWQGYRITNLSDPAAAQDADTVAARILALADYLLKSGGTMSGDIAMDSHLVTGLPTPGADGDAARKKYVDDMRLGVWLNTEIELLNTTSPGQDWTSLGLGTNVPSGTKIVFLRIYVGGAISPPGGERALVVRKSGTTPNYYPSAYMDEYSGYVAGLFDERVVAVGIDSSKYIDYRVDNNDPADADISIHLLGYI